MTQTISKHEKLRRSQLDGIGIRLTTKPPHRSCRDLGIIGYGLYALMVALAAIFIFCLLHARAGNDRSIEQTLLVITSLYFVGICYAVHYTLIGDTHHAIDLLAQYVAYDMPGYRPGSPMSDEMKVWREHPRFAPAFRKYRARYEDAMRRQAVASAERLLRAERTFPENP